MKNLITAALLICCAYMFAQETPTCNYKNIKLEKAADVQKADPCALQACKAILKAPYKKDEIGPLDAVVFMLKWMEATPDFTFTLDDLVSKLMKDNPDVLPVYMACMGKWALENRANAKDEKQVKLNSIKLLLAYAEDPQNSSFKMSKKMKKLSEANKKGELEKELN
jgi:hypothetical protein